MKKVYQPGNGKRDQPKFLDDARPDGVKAYSREDWTNPAFRYASLANGVIGLRLGGVPFLHGQAMVNGYVGRSETTAVEATAEALFPIKADLVIHAQTACRLSERPELVQIHEQTLDMAFGELRTKLTFNQDCVVTFEGTILKQLTIDFPQLDIQSNDPEQWTAKIITLPAGWDKIEVERVWIQDRPARVVAEHGKRTVLHWLD